MEAVGGSGKQGLPREAGARKQLTLLTTQNSSKSRLDLIFSLVSIYFLQFYNLNVYDYSLPLYVFFKNASL